MQDDPVSTANPRIADNGARWPAITALLAPAADCDCQMLAITINDAIIARSVASAADKRARN